MEEKANSTAPPTANNKYPKESASARIDGAYEDGEIEEDRPEIEQSTAVAEGDDAAAYENEDTTADPTVTNANANDGGSTASLKGMIQFQKHSYRYTKSTCRSESGA